MCYIGYVKKKTFSLLELTVVLLLIGALTTLSITQYIDSQKLSKAHVFESNINEIQKALSTYKSNQVLLDSQTIKYPTSLSDPKFKLLFEQEPKNPYTGVSMLSDDPNESGIQYVSDGSFYRLCIVQQDVDDANGNGVTNEIVPLTTQKFCIGDTNANLNIVFTRNSQAYTSNGTQVDVNMPRYEPGKFRKGIFIEEGTTNVLINPSFETGDISEWSQTGDCSNGQVTVVNNALFEQYAVKLNCPSGKHIWLNRTVNLSGTYTLSIWEKITQYTAGIIGSAVTNTNWTTIGYTNIDKTKLNQWQRTSFTFNQNSFIVLAPWSNILNGSFIGDGVQLEAKPYATSFIDTTRNPEILTISPVSNLFSTQQGTIEVWVNVPDFWKPGIPNWRRIWSIGNATGPGMYWLGYDPTINKIVFSIYDDSGTAQTIAVDKPTNGWHHFVARWSADEMTLFIDGQKVGYINTPNLPSNFASEMLSIGGSTAPTSADITIYDNVNTIIDDLRISNRARTDQEIQAIYLSGKSGQPAPKDADTTLKLNFDGNLNPE